MVSNQWPKLFKWYSLYYNTKVLSSNQYLAGHIFSLPDPLSKEQAIILTIGLGGCGEFLPFLVSVEMPVFPERTSLFLQELAPLKQKVAFH